MNGFTDVTAPTTTTPDPTKHVLYNLGMVLGVDDFDQEFAYLSGRDQWLARDLIGYGTVCGLQVTSDTDAHGPRVIVAPGSALNPRGQLIRVTPAQCAYLNDWLSAHQDDLVRRVGSPVGSSVALYVTLCYRECPTDQVPIAGEPCRTESEATAASRLADDFKLELRFDPPDQIEENALRDFVAWLRQVEISANATNISLEDFLDAIRAAAEPTSPASPPDFMYGSPPSSIVINNADACEYLRAAFRVWVTELRARWRDNNCDAPDEDCVLLAELDVPLVSGWQVDSAQSVGVNEEHRPYLIPLRLLQEWLLCGRAQTAEGGAGVLNGDVTGNISANTVIRLQNQDLSAVAPQANQILQFLNNKWTPANLPAPQAVTLAGEVTGPANNTRVAKIQTLPVSPNAPVANPPNLPANGQVLGFVAGQWQAATLPQQQAAGNFVEHPAGQPKYFIVAAGIARADGSVPTPGRAPVYNELRVVATNDSELNVKFNNYKDPDGTYQYIVKVLPVLPVGIELVRAPIVSFVTFKDGIILRVTDGATVIKKDILARLEFMIEVSQYFK